MGEQLQTIYREYVNLKSEKLVKFGQKLTKIQSSHPQNHTFRHIRVLFPFQTFIYCAIQLKMHSKVSSECSQKIQESSERIIGQIWVKSDENQTYLQPCHPKVTRSGLQLPLFHPNAYLWPWIVDSDIREYFYTKVRAKTLGMDSGVFN